MITFLSIKRVLRNITITILIMFGAELYANIHLIFWIDYADEEEVEFYRKQIRIYENSNPDVTISLERFKDLQIFLMNRFKSSSMQDLPDIIRGVSDGIGVFAENDMIRPIDEFLKENELEQFDPVFIEGVTYKDAIYALPCSFEILCLFVNMDYFPKTINSLSELENPSSALKSEGVLSLATNIVEPYRFIPWYFGFDGTFFDKDNNPVFNKKAFIEATQYILDLLKTGNVIKPEISNETAMVMFTDGWAGTMITGPWDLDVVIKEELHFFVQPLPTVENGRRLKPYIGLKILMLSKSSRHPNEAMKFARFLTSKEIQQRGYTETYAIPTRTDMGNLTGTVEDKYIQGFLSQAKYGVIMPTNPVMADIWEILAATLPRVFHRTVTPESAADSIDSYIKSLR